MGKDNVVALEKGQSTKFFSFYVVINEGNGQKMALMYIAMK